LGQITKMLSKPTKTMKFNSVVNLLALAAILSASAVGCRKGTDKVTPIPKLGGIVGEKPGGIADAPPVTDRNAVTPANPDGTFPTPKGSKADWTSDGGATFRDQIVYFDYDKSTVRASEVSKIQTVATRMRSEFPGKALRIEGHCDERGTEEYNRSLGERRALAVRENLIRLGMDPEMVETVSYGEDRPAVPGHDETAWSKNRRAEIMLLTPPGAAASR
jgi:peptidoglycan-associated lipoprotein